METNSNNPVEIRISIDTPDLLPNQVNLILFSKANL